MTIFTSMNTTASALTAQRLRMDVISSNMANVDTTRGRLVNGEWEPYKRKQVVFQEQEGSFASHLNAARGNSANTAGGVKVSRIVEDDTPFEMVYDPENPEADETGYVRMPNVDPLRETVDLMSASRSYEANVTVLNASKSMLMKTLEIGK
ncbi:MULTISPECIES: flagellar basal body rod protein FlgC [Niallia]|jgi:flagellar basal-body rod protein FlgC|uniref:flagellar basal body rod protein FlgC n=1 Tax=Niallia TaxID=2837506 RepID=UPI000F44E2BF|nr:flagellar basal body rod protein FlgC [Niallia circulans]AYV66009.1 flagellar basal body rod protein FlgC [Niallia circulans]AYV71175.1 flagellar basal body rod protein FlgC [Niallia circulans]QJX61902.1 flagellar basal body rod protein FlgC [Niallia circulans]UQZ73543.1 flagellar basal body rod protein FlgC [Niallia circulans]